MTRPLRLGTRRSALATTQSGWVADALRARGADVELVEITTHGDVDRAPLAVIGGTGVFVSALRDALLAGEVDLAVHSLKDLPTAAADGLALAAVPQREDPRDALVAADGRTLAQLPAGARVGTGSPRRRALLLDARPDLDVVPVRGNVDTRLRMVSSGELDAVVLAAAGLARLGRLGEATELLDAQAFVPAPGQGALAVECRADDAEVLAVAGALDSPADRLAVLAERQLLAGLEAGCSAPVGAHAHLDGGELRLALAVQGPDGLVRRDVTGAVADPGAARALGQRTAVGLLAGPLAGAADALEPLATPARPPAAAGGAQEHTPDRAPAGPRPDPESGS
ncbi:hydroxymethylbilane synthase [Paenibacillus sp. TRM 82003]|uniref:hydroxymethylbilane synthase n=1 Tax=Kineococcus sp. TRM81007 TaxID=2925831 RepID=UPI001F59DB38|nr:hydroxymethylbilane synthase [Kineococcus sp. TRM81007]MCI2238878.1 hydroxymethylbilane synthase [Kineococcus sp. TRM81007]MCI3924283.1 hydroxymethylbilane synthase [Paenibacillus sp. TRM 82003]